MLMVSPLSGRVLPNATEIVSALDDRPRSWRSSLNIEISATARRSGLLMNEHGRRGAPTSVLSSANSMMPSTIRFCINSAIRRNRGSASDPLSPEIKALGMPLIL